MCYNVCYECVTEKAVKKNPYGAHCKAHRGACSGNVLQVLTQVQRQFIGLVEATPDIANMAVLTLNKKFKDSQYMFVESFGTYRLFLIYDARRTELVTETVGSSVRPLVQSRQLLSLRLNKHNSRWEYKANRGRPALCALFRAVGSKGRGRTIAVAVMHGPHVAEGSYVKHNLREMFAELSERLRNTKLQVKNVFTMPAIVMGDFNVDMRHKFTVECPDEQFDCRDGQGVTRKPCPVFQPLIAHNTCCTNPAKKKRGGAKYSLPFDQILFTPGSCNHMHIAAKPAEEPRVDMLLSSDHAPVAAALSLSV